MLRFTYKYSNSYDAMNEFNHVSVVAFSDLTKRLVMI